MTVLNSSSSGKKNNLKCPEECAQPLRGIRIRISPFSLLVLLHPLFGCSVLFYMADVDSCEKMKCVDGNEIT